MNFLKGLLSYIIMMVLSICILLWLSFNLVNHTFLSVKANSDLINNTTFTSDLVDEILVKYNTNVGQLNFEEEDLIKLINESAEGIINYSLLESETLPTVDVLFIKNYISDIISEESKNSLDGKLNISEFVETMRKIPDGSSISESVSTYIDTLGIETSKEEIDNVVEIFISNKELTNEEISTKIVDSIVKSKINLDSMNTELSLQDLFDKLTKKNPLNVLRRFMEIYNKNVNGYLNIAIILLILLLFVIEFRIGSMAMWVALSLIFSIIPIQIVRLADYFVDKELLSFFSGMSNYTTFMLSESINRLNLLTIIVVVIIVILFVLSKILKSIRNKKSEENKVEVKRYRIVRIAGFLVLLVGLFLNGKSSYEMNQSYIAEVKEINVSDFDLNSIDLTLRELLNVNYDF